MLFVLNYVEEPKLKMYIEQNKQVDTTSSKQNMLTFSILGLC